jgi:hypothetical protein
MKTVDPHAVPTQYTRPEGPVLLHQFAGDAPEGGCPRQRDGLPSAEERLVARCLWNDEEAWQIMFRDYHPRLVRRIKSMICGGDGTEQAEEIAAAVWSLLCSRDFPLLRRYDAKAGRLISYMAGLARRELWKMRRSARHRQSRESLAARREWTTDESSRDIVMHEFLAMLTRREREFCVTNLLRQPDGSSTTMFSSANTWQLRSRILKKFRSYLTCNSQ